MSAPQDHAPGSSPGRLWPWLLALALLHLAVTLPVLPFPGAGNDYDETHYHYPAVVQIRGHWPRLDLVADSLSPIAPGYHYFLATVAVVTGDSLLPMRLVNDLVSLPIPLLLCFWLSRYVAVRSAFLLTLPLALNGFFLKAACRVVTDNAALLTALLAWMAIFLLPARGVRGLWAGAAATLGTAVRQLNIALVGPALLQLVLDQWPNGAWRRGERPALGAVILPLLARLAPFLVVAWLVHAWHGLVAPQWQGVSSHLSAAPVAFLLVLAGLFGGFFWLSLGGLQFGLFRNLGLLGAMALGLVITLISPTNWSGTEGRWGGWLWLIVHHMPTIGLRSPVFMVLSPVGAGFIYLFARRIWQAGMPYHSLLWLSAMLAWISTFAVGTNAYQHYFEPTLLVLFAVACGLIRQKERPKAVRPWPIYALIAYGVAMTAVGIYAKVFLHLGLTDLPTS